MNKLYCLIIMFITCGICKAQNLVPNPSFEDTLGCPQFYPDLDGKCANWLSFRGTPDYMHNCSSVCGYYNQYGHLTPHSGQAYTGILQYQITASNRREHIGVQLISPLDSGTKYFLSFYVATAFNYSSTNIACNKTGALVTTYQYSDPFDILPLPNTSTIWTDSIITDTLNWVKISGSFIADSAYQYLVIGNYFDDNNIDTINFPYQVAQQANYLYLDDVCLSTDSLTCNPTVGINEVKNQDELILFPNPFTDKINITAKRNELVEINFYDVTARKIFSQSFTNSTSINTEQLAKGIYLYEVRNKNGVIKKGKVVKE